MTAKDPFRVRWLCELGESLGVPDAADQLPEPLVDALEHAESGPLVTRLLLEALHEALRAARAQAFEAVPVIPNGGADERGVAIGEQVHSSFDVRRQCAEAHTARPGGVQDALDVVSAARLEDDNAFALVCTWLGEVEGFVDVRAKTCFEGDEGSHRCVSLSRIRGP